MMRTISLIILVFLVQFAYSSKYIKFLMRGTTNKCDDSGNYIFDLLIKEYEGVESFNIILKEPSYVLPLALLKEMKLIFMFHAKLTEKLTH